MTRILFIERTGSFSSALKKRYDVTSVPNGKQALELARANEYAVVVLDAISLRTPGDRIARQLRDGLGTIPLIHLHPGTKETADTPAEAVLFLPFTTRKLVNQIERLLNPMSSDSVITCGQFSFNVTRRVLIANGQETTLTPKLALLVETFFRHPGATLDRKLLMERVWDTSYMGDTRTLDVHIRWIRRAIEENPSDPRYLRTVRGVGYRLEIPAETTAANPPTAAVASPAARRARSKLTLQKV